MAVDVAAVRAALAEAHPGIDVAGARVVDNGWDFVVLDTGAWVFRVPRRAAVAATLRVERLLLALLRSRLPLPVPDLSLHALPDGTPYALAPRLPGEPATGADAAWVGAAVVPLLTALHAVDPTDAVLLGLAMPAKLDLDLLAARAAAEVVPLLPWDAVTALRAAFAVLSEPIPVHAVVHADLALSNILVSERRVSGILDWTDSHVGDPAMDLTWFVQSLGVPAARAALAAYVSPEGVDAETLWRRAAAHATVQPVHAVLYGLDHGNDAYVRKQLARIVGGLPPG
jgi:aminoglycoside phosphotransferase (APT) family kinase protein